MPRVKISDIRAVYQRMADDGKLLPYLKGMDVEIVTSSRVPKDEVLVLLNPTLKQDENTLLSTFRTREKAMSDIGKIETFRAMKNVTDASSFLRIAQSVQSALRILLRGEEGFFGRNSGREVADAVRTRLEEGVQPILDDMKGSSGKKRYEIYGFWNMRIKNVSRILASVVGEAENIGSQGPKPKEKEPEPEPTSDGENNGDGGPPDDFFSGTGDFGGDGGIWRR